MSAAQHTPGPWVLTRLPHGSGRDPQQAADNRLVAAAPDLLEACEAAAAFFGPHPADDLHPPQTVREHEAMAALVSLVKQLAAAIQKARGV